MRQFRLAQTGEGIKECELVQWFVKEGDEVEEFGRVCEVQSDKATIEISSPYAGVVRRLHHKPGDVVQVGEVLADIHTGEEEEAPAAAAAGAAAGARAPQPAGGAAAPSFAAAGVQPSYSSSDEQLGEGKVLTSPAVRHLARQYGINLRQVPATGPGGRVLKGDVLAYIEGMQGAGTAAAGRPSAAAAEQAAASMLAAAGAAAAPLAAAPPPLAPAAAAAAAGEESLEPVVVQLRGYRKVGVRQMVAAAGTPAGWVPSLLDAARAPRRTSDPDLVCTLFGPFRPWCGT
jgi:2-oxoisovalerate dehydrogenase E2 component (dihydrolipoyl transacylase)